MHEAILRARRIATALAVGLALALVACGDEPPEKRLREAGETLEEARARAEVARRELDAAQEDVGTARSELEAAQRDLEKARERVAEARARVDEVATDVALFRAVQLALLSDEALRQHALNANVENGIVTVRGSVDTAREKERALEIARKLAGVERVRDAVRVTGGAGAAEG